MEVLRLENLSKFYTSESSVVVGLTGISLSFSTGEFVALTGESGSGKSTLAHVLGGILPYESGELYIYGQPTSHYDSYDWSKYRRDLISFISQSYGILQGNTVSENIESALRLSGMSQEDARVRAADILKEVELSEFSDRKAGKLSSGQKQRLSIARALAKPSKILIADEPTGNLDRENSEKVIALLKRASKDRLVILITHEFDEAKDAATRRIVLSDGTVVTDANLADISAAQNEEVKTVNTSKRSKSKSPLAPYICRLTMRSRPIFTLILCLLMAVTFFISFVFVGNFMIALDDTPTRIYNSKAFFNGSSDRLLVMRSDGELFTDEDYNKIVSCRYVESLDRLGAFNDLVYHYRIDIDHKEDRRIITGDNYDPILNPDDYTVKSVITFIEKNYNYAKTLPYTGENILTSGRKAEGIYEVVSADPAYSVGDTVRVYIRDKSNWRSGAYFEAVLDVVGTTDVGDGLYFSDKMANAMLYPMPYCNTYAPYAPRSLDFVFAAFDPNFVELMDGEINGFELEDGQFLFPPRRNSVIPRYFALHAKDGEVMIMSYAALHTTTMLDIIYLTENDFNKLVYPDTTQISVYMEDYSYTDRVVDQLTSQGYITVSPYRLGSTEVDEELAQERMITLVICAATFIIAFVLQCILLRVMFASTFEHYRLMSNTGLTANIAYGAISLTLLFTTIIGEMLGAGVIYVLNELSVSRITNIFKYLDTPLIVILFSLHFVTVMLSVAGILVAVKKNVFGKGKSNYDIDFNLMEEDAE